MQGYSFTERTKKVLAMARDEAKSLSHEYIGTEHMLLGLLREHEGVAATVLQNLDVDIDQIRESVLQVIKRGRPYSMSSADLPYTSRAKKVIELSMNEARQLHHSYVGTEHLLLGLLAEEKGIAAQVLTGAGLSLEVVRAETLRILGTESSVASGAQGQPTSGSRAAAKAPPQGEKPQRVSLTLHYSNGATIAKSFANAAEASSFLSAY